MKKGIIKNYIMPGLELLLDCVPTDTWAAIDNEKARAMLLAIGLQESRFECRKQIGGPARGFWQFERAGIRGVLTHPATKIIIADVCFELAVPADEEICHGLVAYHDVLACCFARLLLWTLPRSLPAEDATVEAWRQYIEAWRPGKPRNQTWDKFYAEAWATVKQK